MEVGRPWGGWSSEWVLALLALLALLELLELGVFTSRSRVEGRCGRCGAGILPGVNPRRGLRREGGVKRVSGKASGSSIVVVV